MRKQGRSPPGVLSSEEVPQTPRLLPQGGQEGWPLHDAGLGALAAGLIIVVHEFARDLPGDEGEAAVGRGVGTNCERGTDRGKSLFMGKGSQAAPRGSGRPKGGSVGSGGWGQGNPGGSGVISTGFQRRPKATLGAHWTQIQLLSESHLGFIFPGIHKMGFPPTVSQS